MTQKYIVELTNQELQIIAQMLHMRILDGKRVDSAEETLKSLALQGSIIGMTPEVHKVFPDPLTAPQKAVRFKGSFYVPL